MNTKILGVLLILIVLGGIGVFAFQSSEEQKNTIENSVIDNSNFGTSNSNSDGGNKIAAGYVAGHVTIGPNCPVDREDKPCKTPPEAYSSRRVIVYDSDGTTVNVTGAIDANGNYKIPLGPGNYFIQIEPAGIGPGEKKPVTIKSWETSTVDFDIDTGIR